LAADPVGRIGSQPLGLDAEARFGALDHGPGGTHLGLPDGTRGFDIHDDAELHVDQVVVGVGEEGGAAHGPGPLRRRIGRRDELRRHLAGRTEGRIIEGRQVLLHRPGRCLKIAILVPLFARDRPLLVGVGHDQAGIDRKALAADQASRDAPLHHMLEHAPEDIAVAKALVAGARER
jgi:hypothetical protein